MVWTALATDGRYRTRPSAQLLGKVLLEQVDLF